MRAKYFSKGKHELTRFVHVTTTEHEITATARAKLEQLGNLNVNHPSPTIAYEPA